MASDLYSRYVPPKNKKRALQDTSSVTLSASKLAPSLFENAPLEQTSHYRSSHQSSIQHAPLSTTPRKHTRDSNDSQLEDFARPKRSKGHKSLLLKRDRSAKKSENLTELVPTESEQTGEVHPLQPLPQPEPVPESARIPKFSALPAWLAAPISVSATSTPLFTELGIPKTVSKSLESKGFRNAFPIQATLLRLLLLNHQQDRGDLLVSAATGSGKTLGYVLPMISDLSQKPTTRLRGLVVVPTRDLVYQTSKIFEIGASAFAGRGLRRIRVGTACGDVSYAQELTHLLQPTKLYNPVEAKKRLKHPSNKFEFSDDEADENFSSTEKGFNSAQSDYVITYNSKVDILVCTPGRLAQHLQAAGGLELDYLNWLVLDEADKLINQSYQQFINLVMTSLSKGLKRSITKIILSATLKKDLGSLVYLKLHRPQLVVIGRVDGGIAAEDVGSVSDDIHYLPENLEESAIECSHGSDKPLHLLRLLQDIIMESTQNVQRGALVFANSNEAAMRLSRLLTLLDPTIAAQIGIITSIVAIAERKRAIKEFQDKKLSILIASDVASRGLDLPSLKYVINYDIPASPEIYVHRVGRTARAGRHGHAYTLFLRKLESRPWRKIVKSSSIERPAGSKGVRPVDSSVINFDADRYEEALAILAKEAGKA